jgi:hypothetical protein
MQMHMHLRDLSAASGQLDCCSHTALSLSPRTPSLTQDCLHVPDTIIVGGTLSVCYVHSSLLVKHLIQPLHCT